MSSDQENSRLHMASSITSELLLGRNIDLGTLMASAAGAKPFRGTSGHARLGLRHTLGEGCPVSDQGQDLCRDYLRDRHNWKAGDHKDVMHTY